MQINTYKNHEYGNIIQLLLLHFTEYYDVLWSTGKQY